MDVHEFVAAAQSLSYEQRKELIKALFQQLPASASPAGSIVQIGDLEAGNREIRERVNESIQRSAKELLAPHPEP